MVRRSAAPEFDVLKMGVSGLETKIEETPQRELMGEEDIIKAEVHGGHKEKNRHPPCLVSRFTGFPCESA